MPDDHIHGIKRCSIIIGCQNRLHHLHHSLLATQASAICAFLHMCFAVSCMLEHAPYALVSSHCVETATAVQCTYV